jgi:hypothetical protein
VADEKLPTTAAVVAYALTLRRRAEQLMDPGSPSHDPYAKPYYPMTATAYQLVSRCKRRLIADLGPDPTADQVADAEARAPAAAIEEMKFKAGQAERKRREDAEDSDRRDGRMARRQREAARDRDAARLGLTLGQRLDQALAGLATVAVPRGATLDQKVSGTQQSDGPSWPGDPAAKARRAAHQAVRQVEEELESARRRRVELERAA